MQAFQAAVRGAPLDVALGILARAATKQWDNGVRCGFYRVNRDGPELHHVSGMGESYAECVDSFKVGSNSLACGLAVHTGCPVITPDVLNDPLWQPWMWLAKEYDFRGCWSFPVETEERRVVGTLALDFPTPRQASPQDLEAAATLTRAAAIIISRYLESAERGRAQWALRESEVRFREFGEASSTFCGFAISRDGHRILEPCLPGGLWRKPCPDAGRR